MPERETSPIRPSRKISAGMIPTFAFPGESAPGQLGPSIVIPRGWMKLKIRSISWAGSPSAMQITVSMPASTSS